MKDHTKTEFLKPQVQVFFRDAGGPERLAVDIDQCKRIQNFLAEFAVIVVTEPSKRGLNLAVESISDEIDGGYAPIELNIIAGSVFAIFLPVAAPEAASG